MCTNVYIKENHLKNLCIDILTKHKIPRNDANIISEVLVKTSLRGIDTHGVSKLPLYINRLKEKGIKANPNFSIIRRDSNMCVVDGDNGFGQLTTYNAMNLAIETTKDHGVSFVWIMNNTHFGAASYYSMMALPYNYIGIIATNGTPRLAPWGGTQPILGNNAWSVAIPTKENLPIVLDISNGIVSFGKIRESLNRNEDIPLGWAFNKNGNYTNDPAEAINGALSPMAEHKGYGISVIIAIIAGILSGMHHRTKVESLDHYGIKEERGSIAFVLDISKVCLLEDFFYKTNEMIKDIKNSSRAKKDGEIYLPGELEHITENERREKGIPVNMNLYNKLIELTN